MGKKKKRLKPQPRALTDAQRAALKRIRLRRIWFGILAASYLPAGYLVMRHWKQDFILFVLIWTAGLAFSVVGLRTTRCPRCGGPFHARRTAKGWAWGMALARQCPGCGLGLDADRTGRL